MEAFALMSIISVIGIVGLYLLGLSLFSAIGIILLAWVINLMIHAFVMFVVNQLKHLAAFRVALHEEQNAKKEE
jgi:hypothetical protein